MISLVDYFRDYTHIIDKIKMVKRKNKDKDHNFIRLFFKFAAKSFVESSNSLGDFLNTLDYIMTPRLPSLYKIPDPINKKGLYNLKNRGLVRFSGPNIKLTPKGQVWFKKSYLKYMRDFYPKWDKKWRIVIFDIPQDKHKDRNCFRQKLKSMGFYMLQKSIFVFPYPCEEEIAEICRRLKINDYIDIIKADSVGFRQQEIEKYFNLS